jgi:hypothetical protein
MKFILLIAAFAALGVISRGDVDIKREVATAIKTYDIPTLEARSADLEGQIVRVKFNYRTAQITDDKDGYKRGQLGIWRTDSRAGRAGYQSGYIRVRVPAEAVDWFRKLTTIDATHQTFTVIARVDKADSDRASIELLGREIKTDTKGSHIVW